MKSNVKFLLSTLLGLVILFIYCEYLIYYLVQRDCDYSELDPAEEDPNITSNNELPVNIMILADTHLLGTRNGHWFDKLRREWQMQQSFGAAIKMHKPDIVFILGDITDEGMYCSKEEFEDYVSRFNRMFQVPNTTKMYIIVGNHDIGFHYGISPYLNQRFVSAFDSPAVQMVSIRGNHFVLLNSMALEGDGCFLCRPAELQLAQIEKILKCAKGTKNVKCDKVTKLDRYSKPILMQHFPLYRPSDMICNEPDSAPFPLREERFRERWECLSQEATSQILNQLRPRLAFSGHTHHGCIRTLANGGGVEITVPSFSWRNKDNPSYTLLRVTPNNYAVSRCPMPRESHVINTYIFGFACLMAWCIFFIYIKARRRKILVLVLCQILNVAVCISIVVCLHIYIFSKFY